MAIALRGGVVEAVGRGQALGGRGLLLRLLLGSGGLGLLELLLLLDECRQLLRGQHDGDGVGLLLRASVAFAWSTNISAK